ncbi:MAG TPA: hypothetical protein VM735_01120, partial [Candidatus Kapabacteria bacterium]|nr:hypothetical protein [Candidatus Kapabacteria bacterium]
IDIKKDNTNVVFWAKQSTLVAANTMNITGLRGWTSVTFEPDGTIIEADIVLNGREFQWFTDFNDTVNQAQFVEAVLLHELGHFVGLDHAVAGGASLAIGANGVTPEAGLSEDEIAAMRFLYPGAGTSTARMSGTVRLNGVGILGAAVVADDSHGNLAGATVTRADGTYDLAGLVPGNYSVRVCPLDPGNAGFERLIRGIDVAFEYQNAVTSFSATTNVLVSISAGQNRVQDFSVSGGPAMRITSLSRPTTITDLISVQRFAVTLHPGQQNIFVAVNGATLKSNAVLNISGDGITMGPTIFLENRIAGSIHSLVAQVSVSSNATPGLRSFVVTHESGMAYANGFVEIAAPVPDHNFDGLDDRFQRLHWSPWTSAAAAPAADPDTDFFSNAFEYRTGTNPTNALSFQLSILNIVRGGGTASVTFESDPGRRYQLYGKAVLADGGWQEIGRSFSATTNQLTLTDNNATETKFYRVGLLP